MVAGMLWGTGFAGAVNRVSWVTVDLVVGAALGGFVPAGFTGAAVLAVEVGCLTGAAGTGASFGAGMPTSGAGENVTTRS